MATPTVRQVMQASQSEGGAATVFPGSDTAIGDVIYCFWVENFDTLADMATPSLGTGGTWTLQGSADKGSNLPHIQLWTIQMTVAGANSVTVTDAGVPSEIYIIAYVVAGVGTINDGFSTRVEPANGTTLVMPSITPVSSDDLMLAAYYAHPSTTNWTVASGMTDGIEEETAGFGTMGSARQNLGAGATGTRTFTTAVSRTNRIGLMVAIAGAATTSIPMRKRSRALLIR